MTNTINISMLWDYSKPELSEERFRSALIYASPEEALILQTQIARTYGLRGDFSHAQQILAGIEPQIQNAGIEAQVRFYLERGRTYSSTTHDPESQTPEVKEQARTAYLHAYKLARAGKLDSLAIDALHMMTVVDTAPEDQVEWNRKAIEVMNASSQPEARKWEGSLHNNLGYALHLLGRYDVALSEFYLALEAREKDGSPESIRIAHWMIAWTLRFMGRLDDALVIQIRLERECEEAGEPDQYVYEELEYLYRALKDEAKADFYAERRNSTM